MLLRTHAPFKFWAVQLLLSKHMTVSSTTKTDDQFQRMIVRQMKYVTESKQNEISLEWDIFYIERLRIKPNWRWYIYCSSLVTIQLEAHHPRSTLVPVDHGIVSPWDRGLLMFRMTDMTENITISPTTYVGGNYEKYEIEMGDYLW